MMLIRQSQNEGSNFLERVSDLHCRRKGDHDKVQGSERRIEWLLVLMVQGVRKERNQIIDFRKI